MKKSNVCVTPAKNSCECFTVVTDTCEYFTSVNDSHEFFTCVIRAHYMCDKFIKKRVFVMQAVYLPNTTLCCEKKNVEETFGWDPIM